MFFISIAMPFSVLSLKSITCLYRPPVLAAIIGVPVDYDENMRLTKHLGEVSHTL